MEVEQLKLENTPAMTFDEVSMERSKSFVKALQELKNLRPQLYSAAEYCEKSYLQNEQKQMVLDNLKDYAVRALVNAVDHLGTVAYKLTDLVEQQTLDVTSMELKVTCLDQRLLTCKTYTEKEGLRQQQLLAIIPRHHKHYILPNSAGKKVHFSPQVKVDSRQHSQARPRLYPSGTPAAKTLSWHLATETKSTLKGTSRTFMSPEEAKGSEKKASAAFNLLDEESTRKKSYAARPQSPNVGPASSLAMQTLGVTRQGTLEGSKPLTPYRSFDNPRRDIIRAHNRSRSMLSAFFVKHKTPKLKTSAVS
ncbi:PREDICTED: protein ABIL1 [Nicotiana attenuata]|uniref:Protein abil1 n=1 Tax=Nicotiana attenuata TaxID=49451 RepID=A0A1J6IR91_NICAT|nr:PREDICTED: protein ABIL1 [Nicotiana attenuata]OIT07366.1 protein abil1 [Nicotiana attenuata]